MDVQAQVFSARSAVSRYPRLLISISFEKRVLSMKLKIEVSYSSSPVDDWLADARLHILETRLMGREWEAEMPKWQKTRHNNTNSRFLGRRNHRGMSGREPRSKREEKSILNKKQNEQRKEVT
jgi:hypothetical protein